jgi:hypothetical protein
MNPSFIVILAEASAAMLSVVITVVIIGMVLYAVFTHEKEAGPKLNATETGAHGLKRLSPMAKEPGHGVHQEGNGLTKQAAIWVVVCGVLCAAAGFTAGRVTAPKSEAIVVDRIVKVEAVKEPEPLIEIQEAKKQASRELAQICAEWSQEWEGKLRDTQSMTSDLAQLIGKGWMDRATRLKEWQIKAGANHPLEGAADSLQISLFHKGELWSGEFGKFSPDMAPSSLGHIRNDYQTLWRKARDLFDLANAE